MEGLRLREFKAVSSFLQGLYAFRDRSGLRTYILSALPRVVPADSISYNEANPQARRNDYVSAPAVPAEYEPAFLRHMGDHPLISRHRATGDGRAARISDFLPQRRFHRLALYNEFFRPLRLEYQAAVTLPARPPLVVGIALGRRLRDFSDREARLLNLLRPHLVEAYRNADVIARMREEQMVTRWALDGLPHGLVALTREGRVRLVNAGAVGLLAAYCGGPPRRGDRLPDALERWVKLQAAEAGEPAPGPARAPLVIGRAGHNLVVRLVGGADERLLLLEEQTSVLSPHAFLPLGLTRREADVMTWVVQGKTNAEIATILGMSAYTVIKHLQHVFAKLGVGTRTAAAAHVLKAVKILPA